MRVITGKLVNLREGMLEESMRVMGKLVNLMEGMLESIIVTGSIFM